MGTLSFTIGAQTRTYTISSTDITRIINALAAQYGPIGTGNGGTRPMTAAEVFTRWTSEIMESLTDVVQTTETAAAVAAVVPPTPIVAT